MSEPYGDPVGLREMAGLAVMFKALIVKLGGSVVVTEADLLHAEQVTVHIDATPEVVTIQLVEGMVPPDVPRFDTREETG